LDLRQVIKGSKSTRTRNKNCRHSDERSDLENAFSYPTRQNSCHLPDRDADRFGTTFAIAYFFCANSSTVYFYPSADVSGRLLWFSK
jgi:hypothetical protein